MNISTAHPASIATIRDEFGPPSIDPDHGHVATAAAPLLDRLLAIAPGPHRIVSCYIRLTPDQRARRAYLTALRSRMRDQREAGVARDLARILAQVSDPRSLPRAGGLALFACEALQLYETAALPRVHRTRVVVDDTPHVLELVAARKELRPVAVAVFDRSHARFFQVDGVEAGELEGLIEPSRRGGGFHGDRGDAPGWGEHDFHQRMLEERHRHCAAIARRLQQLVRTMPLRGFVLAGPRKEVEALLRFLPHDLAPLMLGTAALNPTAVGAAEVQSAALAVTAEHDRNAERALAESLEQAVGGGWAVDGPRDSLRALARGQVRTLLVRHDLGGAGFRCAASGRLALAPGDCRGEGEPVAVQDVADEAVEDALRQGVEVVVLHDRVAAETIDGMAAYLRFR